MHKFFRTEHTVIVGLDVSKSILSYQNIGAESMARKRGNMENKFLDATALTVAIVGAVNWALIGIFRFDLVAFLFGDMSWFSRIVYIIVGLCGIYLLSFYMRLSKDRI